MPVTTPYLDGLLGQLFACTEQGGALVAEAPDG